MPSVLDDTNTLCLSTVEVPISLFAGSDDVVKMEFIKVKIPGGGNCGFAAVAFRFLQFLVSNQLSLTLSDAHIFSR